MPFHWSMSSAFTRTVTPVSTFIAVKNAGGFIGAHSPRSATGVLAEGTTPKCRDAGTRWMKANSTRRGQTHNTDRVLTSSTVIARGGGGKAEGALEVSFPPTLALPGAIYDPKTGQTAKAPNFAKCRPSRPDPIADIAYIVGEDDVRISVRRCAMIKVGSVALLAAATLAVGNSPPSPLAEGPFDSVVAAARAARKCGIEPLRLEVRRESTLMFYAGEPEPQKGNDSKLCLARWQKAHAKRLSLVPRWFQYDYGPRPQGSVR